MLLIPPRCWTALPAALLLAGCATKTADVVVYEPRLTPDVLAPGIPAAKNGFTLAGDPVSTGRFACPLALARLVPGGPDRTPLLTDMPAGEGARWAETLRGVEAVRQLVFVRPTTLRPELQDTAALCESARRLGAPLLLIYTPNQFGPNSAQVLGVLLDTTTCTPVAGLQAEATFLDDEGQETSPLEVEGDQRDRDARFQAQRRFEQHLLACLRDLIHRDIPPTATQPSDWQQPFIQRWWIRFR